MKEREIENPPQETTLVVMEKEQEKDYPKTKKIVKIKIKKKGEDGK